MAFSASEPFQKSVTEFPDDPWHVSMAPQRQMTDSILECKSVSLRHQLEQTVAQLLQSHLGTASPAPPGLPFEGEAETWTPAAFKIPEPPGLSLDAADRPCGAAQDRAYQAEPQEKEVAEPLTPSTAPSVNEELVKPEVQLARDKAAAGLGLGSATTVMIRHIAPKFTQRRLIREMNLAGFSGRYDFVYIPMDSRRRSNRGIAFVNFISSVTAMEFYRIFHGRTLQHVSGEKALSIMPAEVQGFEENAVHHAAVGKGLDKNSEAARAVFLRPIPGHSHPADSNHENCPPVAAAPARPIPTLSVRAPRPPPIAAIKQDMPSSVRIAKFCMYCGGARVAMHAFCPLCGSAFGSS